MPPKDKRKHNLKKLYSFPVFIILLVLAITTLRALYSSYERYQMEDKKVNNSIEDLAAMEQRENKLRSENEWLKTNRGQEELFREQYMVAKEGENVMVITSDKNDQENHTVTTETKDTGIISKTKKIIGVNE